MDIQKIEAEEEFDNLLDIFRGNIFDGIEKLILLHSRIETINNNWLGLSPGIKRRVLVLALKDANSFDDLWQDGIPAEIDRLIQYFDDAYKI